MDIRYKHVERALSAVLEIKAARMGSFRGRLQYLRIAGIFPKPGTGQQIAYSPKQALAVLIALLLERAGLAPRSAVSLTTTIMKTLPYERFTASGVERAKAKGVHAGDLRLMVSHSEKPLFRWMEGDARFSEIEKSETARESEYTLYSVINISKCIDDLDRELTRAVAAG